MHAKSDLKKSARQAKSIGKTNTKSMSAPLQQSIFRAKIHEKSHVFWDIDFEGILRGFWEGFGRPKSSIFTFFSMFFRCKFRSAFLKAKKSKKNAPRSRMGLIWGRPGGMRGLRGREKERGGSLRCRIYRKQAGYRRSQARSMTRSMMVYPARPVHLRWAADSIVTPWGGPPPPTLFGPSHCNRTDLRGRTLGVCTLQMVSLLSLFSIL